MIKVYGEFKNYYCVEIPADSFSDILIDKMSIKESDEMIKDAIYKKYGDYPDELLFVREVK